MLTSDLLHARLLVITGCLIAGVAIADNSGDQPAALGNVQVTATRGEQSVLDVAAAVTVVDADTIRQNSPQVLPEILRGKIGTWFQQTTPGQGTVVVRGLKGSQILHLVDGMRLNNAFFRSAPNQYLALVDAFNTNRIEVVRGPGATLYGADAMGGVVQILTSENRFANTQWTHDLNTVAGWSSADIGRSLHAEYHGGRQGFSIGGGVTWQSFGNRDTGSGSRISNSDYESRAANLKMLWDISDTTELMLGTQILEQPKTPRVDELVPGFGETNPASEQFWFRPNRREFYHLRLRHLPRDTWFSSLELHIAQQKLVDDRRTQNFGEPLVIDEFNDSELTGLTLQLDSYPDPAYRLVYGLEIYLDDVKSARHRQDTTVGMLQPVASRFPDDSSMDSVAAYLHNEWQVTPRWLLSGGLRYSVFDIEFDDPATGQAMSIEPDKLTGNFSINYLLTNAIHLVTNLSRGFRPPNIFDLGTLGPRPGNRFNISNPALDSETIDTIDFGIKANNSNWAYEAFVYYSDYQDKINSVATGGVTADGRTIVQSDNLDSVQLYGFEFGGWYRINNRAELSGVLNYTRGEEKFDDGSDEPADRIPPLNGKISLHYDLTGDLLTESYVLFAAEQDRLSDRDVNDSRIDPDGTPGWATLNLDLLWRRSKHMEWSLRLENLLDKEYREHGSGIDAPGRSISIVLNSRL